MRVSALSYNNVSQVKKINASARREALRVMVICVLLSLVMGHAGAALDLGQQRSEFAKDLTNDLGDSLLDSHTAYLDFVYGAAMDAQTLGQVGQLKNLLLGAEDKARQDLEQTLQALLERYGRYSSIWVLDSAMRAVAKIEAGGARSVAYSDVELSALESVIRTKQHDISRDGYVSAIVPRHIDRAETEPRQPESYAVLPFGGPLRESQGFLVLVADSGTFVELHLKRLGLYPLIRGVELRFDSVDQYWRFDHGEWFLRSKVGDEGESNGDKYEKQRIFEFEQEQVNLSGDLIGEWKERRSVYNQMDGSPRKAIWFDLNPTIDIRVFISDAQWQSLLDDHYDKTFWQTYIIDVVGALAIGLGVSALAFIYIIKRAANRAKYFAERRRAETDHLTGAMSRHGFERLALSPRSRGATLKGRAICFIDVDHFKRVNDTYGHCAGDCVLVEIVKVLSEQKRSDDLLVRWGGEEFLVLLGLADLGVVREIAERLRSSIEEEEFLTKDQLAVAITVSVGVAIIGDDGFNSALVSADEALYRAKRGGRNQVQLSI